MLILFFEFVLFGLLGLALEVVFTGALWQAPGHQRNHLVGFSSILYIPLYGLTPLLLHGLRAYWHEFFFLPFYVRGVVYMLIIYACEFSWMWLLRKWLGSSPSEKAYYESKRSFYGLVRWDFAPAWFIAGLALEFGHNQVLHRLSHW